MSKKSKMLFAAGASAALALFVGVIPAQAAYDSGAQTHGCGSDYGRLTARISPEAANSWAPGDWNENGGSPMYHAPASSSRNIVDMQNNGYGGGYWRLVSGGNATSVNPSCSPAGL